MTFYQQRDLGLALGFVKRLKEPPERKLPFEVLFEAGRHCADLIQKRKLLN
jgi:hypothetical protein